MITAPIFLSFLFWNCIEWIIHSKGKFFEAKNSDQDLIFHFFLFLSPLKRVEQYSKIFVEISTGFANLLSLLSIHMLLEQIMSNIDYFPDSVISCSIQLKNGSWKAVQDLSIWQIEVSISNYIWCI